MTASSCRICFENSKLTRSWMDVLWKSMAVWHEYWSQPTVRKMGRLTSQHYRGYRVLNQSYTDLHKFCFESDTFIPEGVLKMKEVWITTIYTVYTPPKTHIILDRVHTLHYTLHALHTHTLHTLHTHTLHSLHKHTHTHYTLYTLQTTHYTLNIRLD